MNFSTYSGKKLGLAPGFLGGGASNYVKDTEGSSKNQ